MRTVGNDFQENSFGERLKGERPFCDYSEITFKAIRTFPESKVTFGFGRNVNFGEISRQNSI